MDILDLENVPQLNTNILNIKRLSIKSVSQQIGRRTDDFLFLEKY